MLVLHGQDMQKTFRKWAARGLAEPEEAAAYCS